VGIFIEIVVDETLLDTDRSRRLAQLCPVDIFTLDGEQLVVRPDQEDECTLCELCLHAAPPGAITIRKTYNGQTLVSDGAGE
jgi:ferredoxin